MMRISSTFAAAMAASLITTQVQANFWDRAAEGYWWYEDPIPAPPEEPEPEPSPTVEPPASEPAPEQKPVAVSSGPAPFSAAWLREKLPLYREEAVDRPTEENVRRYYYVQKIALDKATRFSEVAQRVVTGDPFLDENARRPTATYAAQVMADEAVANQHAALKKLAGDVGVLFFYRSDCPYCEAQAEILQMLQRRFGFSVLPIALDDRPLPGGKFPDFRYNPALVRQLGVEIVPTLYLARPRDNKMGAIAHGAVSLEDLQRRILLASVTAGWLTEYDFKQTRPVQATPLAATLDPPPIGQIGQIESDPAALVEYIRDQLKRGRR